MGSFLGVSGGNNDDYDDHDSTRIGQMKRINTDSFRIAFTGASLFFRRVIRENPLHPFKSVFYRRHVLQRDSFLGVFAKHLRCSIVVVVVVSWTPHHQRNMNPELFEIITALNTHHHPNLERPCHHGL